MPQIGDTYLNLADGFKRSGAGESREAIIAELLSQTNEIMLDAHAMPANDGASHISTVRTGLPSTTWRKLYKGVPVSKSTTQQVRDTCGMLESFSSHDRDLVDKQVMPQRFRIIESRAHLEAMGQEMAATFIYGDTAVDPEKFMGLAPRYDAYQDGDDTKSSFNVIDAGGEAADANTSIWFVKWGDSTAHFIYPKGSKAGLRHDDLGLDTVEDSDGNPYRAYRDHYKHDIGFVVKDWRAIARVANIDVAEMRAGNAAIEDFMLEAFYRTDDTSGTMAIYCNREVQVALHKRAKSQQNVNLTLETFEGRKVVSFLGAPIRRVRAIRNDEALVPADV